jgi:hypothetical protein
MHFLVMDLGNEDLILGYPWLATFEPQFNWRNSVVDTAHLPIVVQCNVPTGRLSDLDVRGCLSGSTTTKCVTS